MNAKYVGLLVGALVFVGVGFFAAKILVPTQTTPPVGAVPGGEFTEFVQLGGGVRFSGSIATSSEGSPTVKAAEFRSWVRSSLVSYSPGLVVGGTLTLPASSTIPDVVPKPGDRATFCMQNSTSTLLVPVTIAGGVGTKLLVASSSATAVGSTKLFTGKIGCFTLIREIATSSAYDIDVLLDVWQ